MNLPTVRNYPVTIAIVLAVLAVHWMPAMSSLFQLDFSLVADGQWWRIWAGHLTHYDGNHLFWDLLTFAALGGACESRAAGKHGSATYAITLILMAAGISAGIAFWCEGILTYRGLSGLDTGLFVWFVTDESRRSWRSGDRRAATIWLIPCLALIGKLLFEAATGQTLFVDSTGFTPLVESHLIGAGFGLLYTGIGLIGGWSALQESVPTRRGQRTSPAIKGRNSAAPDGDAVRSKHMAEGRFRVPSVPVAVADRHRA